MKELAVCLVLLAAIACSREEELPDRSPGPVVPQSGSYALVDSVVATVAARAVPGTTYLRGTIDFALQEDGTGEQLWRAIRLSQVPVLYDIGNGLAYVRLSENGPSTFGIHFPDTLRAVAYGWEDEDGFPFANVIEFEEELYLSVYELAERNSDLAYLTSGYGEVYYFPALLLQFMEDNYYPRAEYAGPAWREVYRRRLAKANYLSS